MKNKNFVQNTNAYQSLIAGIIVLAFIGITIGLYIMINNSFTASITNNINTVSINSENNINIINLMEPIFAILPIVLICSFVITIIMAFTGPMSGHNSSPRRNYTTTDQTTLTSKIYTTKENIIEMDNEESFKYNDNDNDNDNVFEFD